MQKMLVSTNYKVKKHRGDASQCGFCDFDDTCRQCEKVLNSNYEVRKHHVRTHASPFGFCDKKALTKWCVRKHADNENYKAMKAVHEGILVDNVKKYLT